MPPDAVRREPTSRDANERAPEQEPAQEQRSRRAPGQLSRGHTALALLLVLAAAAGLCRVSGLWTRLTPLPMPTGTATATAVPTFTLTPLPTLTSTPSPTLTSVPTPSATPVPVIMVGGQAKVIETGAARLRLRSLPGLAGETLAMLEDDTLLTVLDGPESADGYQWWQVQTADSLIGWVAADWLRPVLP